jgi:hypothetical protein
MYKNLTFLFSGKKALWGQFLPYCSILRRSRTQVNGNGRNLFGKGKVIPLPALTGPEVEAPRF